MWWAPEAQSATAISRLPERSKAPNLQPSPEPVKTIFLIALSTPLVLAQGPLVPTGPPASSMKTLDQIEPRIPISTLPYTINDPGSYYFTKNLQFSGTTGPAILINSSNVTLDLCGFTLSSTTAVTGAGIFFGSIHNVSVTNGAIFSSNTVTITGTGAGRTWSSTHFGGFAPGINASSASACNFSHLSITGCKGFGMILGSYNIIQSVAVRFCSNDGIFTPEKGNRISDSTSSYNVQEGFDCNDGQTNADNSILTNCTAFRNGGDGIDTVEGVVTGCLAYDNGSVGIYGTRGSVMHSAAYFNKFDGIQANSGAVGFCRGLSNDIGNGGDEIIASGGNRVNNLPAP